MTITNSSVRLAAVVGGVAVAIALMGAVAVAPAKAAGLSASQVQAIVSLLASFGADQGTINNVTAALNGQATTGTGSTGGSTSGGACPVLTRSLQQGSTGADVMALQVFLNGSADTRVAVSGAGSPGMESSYFGPATHAAVVKFQAKNNVSPIGVVGPATRAAIAAVCGTTGGSTGGQTGGSTVLQGGEGQLIGIDNISNDVEDEVDEGQEENVFGIELEAEDSDMMIERVDVDFTAADANDAADSEDLDDYIEEVAIVLDGKVLATLDVDEADENDAGEGDFSSAGGDHDEFSFRFTGLKGVIKEGDTADLYVRVTAVGNVDSGEVNASWLVLIPDDGIRAVDAAGISDTYVSASDLDEESFNVVEPDAGDIDVSASGADNQDRIISVSADSDTNGEEVMVFTIESQTSDNTITDIEIDFSTTSATSTLFSTVINRVHLYDGNTRLASEDITGSNGSERAEFDNLDIEVDEDEEVELRVVVDFNDEADEREGFEFKATVDVSEMEAEDAEGDNVSNINGGTDVDGGTIELRTTGISAEFKSADETRTVGESGQADTVDFTLKFSVTAVGDEDIYLDGDILQSIVSPTAATAGMTWATTTDSNTGTSTYTAILTADDGYQTGEDTNDSGDKRFLIESGETRNFTFRVSVPTGKDDGAVGVRITGLKWDTTDQDNMSNLYNFDMAGWTSDTLTGLQIR